MFKFGICCRVNVPTSHPFFVPRHSCKPSMAYWRMQPLRMTESWWTKPSRFAGRRDCPPFWGVSWTGSPPYRRNRNTATFECRDWGVWNGSIISWGGWFSERVGYLQLWGQDFFRSCSFTKLNWRPPCPEVDFDGVSRATMVHCFDPQMWKRDEKSFRGRNCTVSWYHLMCALGPGIWKRVEFFVWHAQKQWTM